MLQIITIFVFAVAVLALRLKGYGWGEAAMFGLLGTGALIGAGGEFIRP